MEDDYAGSTEGVLLSDTSTSHSVTVLTPEECCAVDPAPQGSSHNLRALQENPPAEPSPNIPEEALTTSEPQETHGAVLPVKAVCGSKAAAQHRQHGGSFPLHQPELRH